MFLQPPELRYNKRLLWDISARTPKTNCLPQLYILCACGSRVCTCVLTGPDVVKLLTDIQLIEGECAGGGDVKARSRRTG